MAKLKIYSFPDDVLAKKAKPIDRVDRELRKLADDMLETMYSAPGVGLAANQVGILKQIVVMDTDYETEDHELEDAQDDKTMPAGGEVVSGVIKNPKPIILINPKIIYREGEILFKEGCLSVPGYSCEVKRSEKIKVEYQDADGLTKTLALDGLPAVCVQHELDHLDGKLFIERLSPIKKEMAIKKVLRERED